MQKRLAQRNAALVLAVLATACGGSGTPAASVAAGGGGPRPTPAPGWTLESVPRDSLLAYGGRLDFDTSHFASDAQNLIFPASGHGGRPSVGPYASIAPEIGTASLNRGQLGSGRIIARIISSAPYAPLMLDSGTTYIWVDSMGAMAGWRMVLISHRAATALAWKKLASHYGTAPRMMTYTVSNCSWTQPAESFAQPCCYCEQWGWCTGDTTMSWSTIR